MNLKLKNIHKTFEIRRGFKSFRKNVLEDINIQISKGDILGLVGQNGSGKTTLLKIILGLIHPDSGEVIPRHHNMHLAYVNTNHRSFFWRLSVRENLTFFGKLLDLQHSQIQKKIEELADRFDVASNLDSPFMTLSSGQMQSINTVRAFLKKPDILLLDEPCTSLDIDFSDNLKKHLIDYIKEKQIPTIWCSHDHNEILETCNIYGLLEANKFKFIEKKYLESFRIMAKNYIYEINCKDLIKLKNIFNIKILSGNSQTQTISVVNEKLLFSEFIKDTLKNQIDILSIEKIRINLFDSVEIS